MIRMIDNTNTVLAQSIAPVFQVDITAIDFAIRGNADLTGITPDPQPEPKPLAPINAKTEAHPEALTKLDWEEMIAHDNPDLHSARSIRQCFVSILVNNDNTIDIFSDIDNRFPLRKQPLPLKLKSGQVIRGIGKTWKDRETGKLRECLQIDNEHFLIPTDETGKRKPVYFHYYELSDDTHHLPKDADQLDDVLSPFILQERIEAQAQREKADPYIKPRISDIFLLSDEYDISQQDYHARNLTTKECHIYASDQYEPVAGGVLEKVETITTDNGIYPKHYGYDKETNEQSHNSRHPSDQDAYDTRYFMTQLQLNETNAELVKTWTLKVCQENQALINEYMEKYKADLKAHSRETFKEIKRLHDSLVELEESYQDNEPIATPTDEMQDAITELADLDNNEIKTLLNTADEADQTTQPRKVRKDNFTNWTSDIIRLAFQEESETIRNARKRHNPKYQNRHSIFYKIPTFTRKKEKTQPAVDKDELKGMIAEAKIASDPTRQHEAHARQFTPTTPDRRAERPHNSRYTMQVEDLPKDSQGNYDDDNLPTNYRYDDIASYGNFTTHVRLSNDIVKPTAEELKEIIRHQQGFQKIERIEHNLITYTDEEREAIAKAEQKQEAMTAGCDFL